MRPKDMAMVLVGVSWWLLAGCESAPRTAATSVQVGMSRSELRAHFGEPWRIEPGRYGWRELVLPFCLLEYAPDL